MTRMLILAMAATMLTAADLDTIRSQTNLEKRSKLALEHASQLVTAAGKEYNAGNTKAALAAVAEVARSVDVSREALRATGKQARKSPKPFKQAEMAIRELLRRLRSLETDFSVDDRPAIVQTEQHLQEIHDDLIQQIMTRKK